jgi:hypothetical protein
MTARKKPVLELHHGTGDDYRSPLVRMANICRWKAE